MPQIDRYAPSQGLRQYKARGISDVASRHYSISPNNDTDLPVRPCALYCNVAGTVAIVDEKGVELSYTLVVGQILPFRGVRIKATGTTATVYGWD
jgi:hypothetical protein